MSAAIPAMDPYDTLYAADPCLAEIRGLDDGRLVQRFGRGVESFDRRIFELSDAQLDQGFDPASGGAGAGRWPVRVLLGHLADAEVLYVHRMRRTISEDRPLLSAWDENAAVESGMYHGGRHPIGAFVAAVHTLRRWTTEWLATLEPSQWGRVALHPERGEMSVRKLAQYDTWHLEHHGRYLNRKVELLLGPAPRGEKPSGGCGPNCGCGKR
ncbi:MAG: DinB family protein [Phycisphaerales bacterium]|nr:DinB family protein [Phycisphaerales bacterium]